MRTRGMKSNLIALAIVTGISIASAAQAANLRDPARSQWGCELSDDDLVRGITAGLVTLGWTVTENDGQGNLVAQVIVRGKHTLIVDINYDSQAFDINYKDSDNLDYKVRRNGTIKIHRNANSWMDNIRNNITMQLTALCTQNR